MFKELKLTMKINSTPCSSAMHQRLNCYSLMPKEPERFLSRDLSQQYIPEQLRHSSLCQPTNNSFNWKQIQRTTPKPKMAELKLVRNDFWFIFYFFVMKLLVNKIWLSPNKKLACLIRPASHEKIIIFCPILPFRVVILTSCGNPIT